MVLAVNWIDFALLIVLALFGLRGYFRGLFREVFSVSGLLAGFMLAVRYDGAASSLAQTYWNLSPLLLKGIAFVAIFFTVYFLFSVTGWLLHHSEHIIFLRTVNRFGGIAVGLGKGTAITALIVFFLTTASWIPASARDKLDHSYLVSPLSHIADGLIRIGKSKLLPKETGEA